MAQTAQAQAFQKQDTTPLPDDVETQLKQQVHALRGTSAGGFLILFAHFVACECRPIIMFYTSYLAYEVLFLQSQIMNSMITTRIEEAARQKYDMGLPEYYGCVNADAASLSGSQMVWDLSPMKTKCIGTIRNQMYGLPVPDNVVVTWIGFVCKWNSAVFILVLMVELIRSGPRHLGHGSYLAFTWKLNHSRPHKICATILVFFCFVLVADFVRFCVILYRLELGFKIIPMLTTMVPPLGGIIGSAWMLLHPPPIPNVDYESKEFKELHFRRSVWTDLAQNNNEFYGEMKKALHDHVKGLSDPIKDIAPGGEYSTHENVVAHVRQKAGGGSVANAGGTEQAALLLP